MSRNSQELYGKFKKIYDRYYKHTFTCFSLSNKSAPQTRQQILELDYLLRSISSSFQINDQQKIEKMCFEIYQTAKKLGDFDFSLDANLLVTEFLNLRYITLNSEHEINNLIDHYFQSQNSALKLKI